jgi:hypothetical protein
VSQTPGHANFPFEPSVGGLGNGIGSHDLHCDVSPMSRIARPINNRVAAHAEDVDDVEATLPQRSIGLHGSENCRVVSA